MLNACRRVFLRIVSVLRSRQDEAELAREIRAHLQLLEDKFIAGGMSREDARYAARRTFGGIEQAKELHRQARSFLWLDSSWLDLKLAARLLVKYPGLTVVGGSAMAFGITVGATAFEAGRQLVSPVIPLKDGHRLVAIRLRDAETTGIEPRVAHDFHTWWTGLDVVRDVGAFRLVERNLTPDGGTAEPIEVAEITAAAFRVAPVPPMIGRTLLSDDETPDAEPVVVIGHDLWRRRFGSDPRIVGRVVRLGTSRPTVVGVMPEGFAFPIAQSIWVPLRVRAGEYPPRGGPALHVFGHLADGVSLERAQAALSTIGQRAASAHPLTHAHLRPEVLPYARSVVDVWEAMIGFTAANVFVVMFLALVCANVGTLVFARAVTRHGEIVVRSALGATRRRIVMQLFAEALVLGAVAAVIGLAASTQVLQWGLDVSEADKGRALPFWRRAELSPLTIFYACALTMVAAVLAGVVPALKVTGGRLESRLRQSALRDSGLAFGGLWTVVIVAQVTMTVAFPATAFLVRRTVIDMQSFDAGFPAHRYLSARLELDTDSLTASSAGAEGARAQVRRTIEELQRRLSAEPFVGGVTLTDRLPRTRHPVRPMEIEPLDGLASEPKMTESVSRASVALNYFDVLGAPILAGRSFHAGDIASSTAVIVNRTFVDRIAGGNAIGRRVRYAASRGEPASRWYEIVGVVKNLGMIGDDQLDAAGIYHPVTADGMSPVHVAVRVNGDPASFVAQLRSAAAAVDPALRAYDVLPLDAVGASGWLEFDSLWRLLGVASGIALLLSLAGIYAIMSFTVSRRTREIGIRVALGASRWRVTGAIVARALAQVSLGIVGGALLVFVLTRAMAGLSLREVGAILIYVAAITVVCLLACAVPIRRALRIQPTEALRAE
jgi:putative ABC transport system permease protein